eukprot:2042091-Rhodomonas_salina.2
MVTLGFKLTTHRVRARALCQCLAGQCEWQRAAYMWPLREKSMVPPAARYSARLKRINVVWVGVGVGGREVARKEGRGEEGGQREAGRARSLRERRRERGDTRRENAADGEGLRHLVPAPHL